MGQEWVRQHNLNLRFFRAASLGDAGAARRAVLQGADPNARWSEGKEISSIFDVGSIFAHYENRSQGVQPTALIASAKAGMSDVVKMLIDRGAHVNSRASNDETPLMAATRMDSGTIGMLIDRGAELEARNVDGETALLVAARQGDMEGASVLIQRGADVNARAKNDVTALHLAISRNSPEIAKLLLNHGADATAKTRGGHTPLDHIDRSRQPELAALLEMRDSNHTQHRHQGE